MRAMFVSLLVALGAVNTAAASSFFERYAGTTISLHMTYLHSDGASASNTATMTFSATGLAMPGRPTMRDRSVVNEDQYTRQALSTSGNTLTLETTQPASKFWATLKVTMNGDGCVATVKSNLYKSTATCAVVTRGKPQAGGGDNPQACRTVQKAIGDMKALISKNKKLRAAGKPECDMWRNAYKLKEIGTSIKGAACPSKFKEVDRLLKSEPRNGCSDRELGEVGVRG